MGTILILLDHVDGIGYCRNCGMRVFEMSPADRDRLAFVKHYDHRHATGTIDSEGSAKPCIIHGLDGLDDSGIPHVAGNTRIQDIAAFNRQQLGMLVEVCAAARLPKTTGEL